MNHGEASVDGDERTGREQRETQAKAEARVLK